MKFLILVLTSLFFLPTSSPVDTPSPVVDKQELTTINPAENITTTDECGEVLEDYSTRPKASLTLVSFRDSKFYNLVQNAQNAYGHCFQGYQKSILMKLTYNSGRRPTDHTTIVNKTQFFAKLVELAREGYQIDIFILTHGGPNTIYLKEGTITGSDIRRYLYGRTDKYGRGRFPIRMVYQMNCYGASLNDEFRQAGADVVFGADEINFYPNQFNRFMKEWNKGNVSVRTAIQRANTTSSRSTMQALIKLDASSNASCFRPKCKVPKTILSNDRKECSYRYFKCQWKLSANKYKPWNGKKIMNESSKVIISGNGNCRKS